MDPLSIAAFVVTIVHVTGKISDGLGRFSNDQRAVPAVISEFHETIQNLHATLRNISSVLEHPQAVQLPSETEHYRDIHRILRSCKTALERLRDELPELAENSGLIDRAKSSLAMSLKRNVIQTLQSNISSYTQVLQLSITTLSLGTMRTQQQSQEQFQQEIRKLTDAIRASPLIPRNKALERRPSTLWDDDETLVSDFEAVAREIEAWRLSADGVAAAITLQDTNRQPPSMSSGLSLSSPDPSVSHSATDVKENIDDDDWDPEPDLQDQKSGPGREIMIHQFKANQDIVEQLMNCGIFLRASFFQKKGIELRQQLMHPGCDVGIPLNDLAEMQERLADILMSCETEQETREAKSTLQGLVEKELKQPVEQQDSECIGRFYHKLGDVYINLGDLARAKTFLSRALTRRQKLQPVDKALETARLYETVLQRKGEFDEARGVRNWIEEVRPSTTSTVPEPEYGELCGWCRDKGFDIDAANFRFDEYDMSLGKSPLHEAVQEEEIQILEKMVKHVVNFESGSDRGVPTPLLLAASTRNIAAVTVLLEHDAQVDVRDSAGMSPLHRCQNQSGGVQVAHQLLQKCFSILNIPDSSGRTALFRACEFGNEKMVTFLLEQGADPNICQRRQDKNEVRPGNVSTPLIAAIEGTTRNPRQIGIVKTLLVHGANPHLVDADGRNAFAWALNRGLVGAEIRELLRRYATDRRMSTLSVSTTATRASQNSDSDNTRRGNVFGKIWSRSDTRRASSESTLP